MVHVKKVDVRGFKSFGTRHATVHFDKGLIGISGPINKTITIETETLDRETNMIEFTTESLIFLRDTIHESEDSYNIKT